MASLQRPPAKAPGSRHQGRGRSSTRPGAGLDAIIVGIGTVLADDPRLTARPPGPRTAARVVLDSASRLPVTSLLASSAREAPVWLAVNSRAPADRLLALESLNVDIMKITGYGSVPIVPLLEALGQRGVTNAMVEGGGRVLGAFFDAGQVDAVDVFIAPLVEGGGHDNTPVRGLGVSRMAEALRLDRHAISVVDGDVRIEGTFARPWLGDDALQPVDRFPE